MVWSTVWFTRGFGWNLKGCFWFFETLARHLDGGSPFVLLLKRKRLHHRELFETVKHPNLLNA